jgi:peptide/nickel transport system permease protein
MTGYLIRRIVQMGLVLILSSIAIYAILNLAPGGPLAGLRMNADAKSRMSATDIARMEKMLGLNKPLQLRYIAWLAGDDWMGSLNPDWQGDQRGILRGDFGTSFKTKQPVMVMIRERLPITLTLTMLSVLLSMIVAIPVGIYSAVKQYSRADVAFTMFTFFGIAIPSFWFGLMLILIFGYQFKVWNLPFLPTSGIVSHVDPRPGSLLAALGATPGSWVDRAVYLFMPVLVLSLVQMAGWGRYMRSSMLEVLRQDYVRTARAKGLAEKVVVGKHAVRNALIPLVTIVTFEITFFFGGAIITERVFSIPGMGSMFITALNQQDYPVVQAYLVILAVLVVLASLLSDILYTVVDPRIRFS